MRAALFCLLCYGLIGPAAAQDDQQDISAQEKAKSVHAWAARVASEIQCKPVDSNRAGQRVDRSLLHWTNPIVGDVFGDCYMWTYDDRPLAFLSIYAFYSPVNNRRLTFQSLSEQPLIAERNQITVWEPKLPGIDWLKLDGLPIPANLSTTRQRQMRSVASSFVARISQKEDSDSFRELRLLSQPLHKYQSQDANITDGALFAFVDGTDPELLLLLECIGGTEPAMRVAPVRQNHRRLLLEWGRQPVWSAAQIAPPFPNPRISDPRGTYYSTTWQTIAAVSDAP